MSYRVLVVDDDEKSRKLPADVLQAHGYEVARAANGAQALAEVGLARPDLVLLDIQLPGASGFQVLQALRTLPGGDAIKVVAMTASVMPQQEGQLASARFDAVLRKPLSLRGLLQLVQQMLPPGVAGPAGPGAPDPAGMVRAPA